MSSRKSFTGKHMLLLMVAFFGVIMVVNFTMARLAISGFSGTVVDNSYVASQQFNDWLKAAEVQERLGWDVNARRDAEGHLAVAVTREDAPLEYATLSAILSHPLGQKEERTINLEPAGEGLYRSVDPVPAGRWSVLLQVSHAGNEGVFKVEMP